MPDLDRMMPSRSTLADWVLKYGQICKEREGKDATEAAEAYGAAGMSDASTELGKGGKKVQVVQYNTIRRDTSGLLRPVMHAARF